MILRLKQIEHDYNQGFNEQNAGNHADETKQLRAVEFSEGLLEIVKIDDVSGPSDDKCDQHDHKQDDKTDQQGFLALHGTTSFYICRARERGSGWNSCL